MAGLFKFPFCLPGGITVSCNDLEEVESHGQKSHVFKGWEQLTPGAMTQQQYDQAVGDLVNYLQWMGEPAQDKRKSLGVWVLLYLALFTVIAWRLNAAFWKDVK